MWKALKGVLGLDGVGETALKIVDKIAGTDWTPADKADFILKHAEMTKYQSPTRRLIATTMVVEQTVLVTTWLMAVVLEHMFQIAGAESLSKDISGFLTSNVNVSVNGIIAFYFLIGIKK